MNQHAATARFVAEHVTNSDSFGDIFSVPTLLIPSSLLPTEPGLSADKAVQSWFMSLGFSVARSQPDVGGLATLMHELHDVPRWHVGDPVRLVDYGADGRTQDAVDRFATSFDDRMRVLRHSMDAKSVEQLKANSVDARGQDRARRSSGR